MKVISYDENLLPMKGTSNSLCLDLKSAENVVINPGEVKLVWLGIKTDFAWKLYVRSSLPLKKGLMLANSVGIIDADYRNEAKAMLYNFTDTPVEIKRWERIAQMEVIWDDCELIKLVDKNLYDNWEKENVTERQWGFGSTGWYLNSN